MIISHNKYCIASKSFPIKFYLYHGSEMDELNHECLMSYGQCENALKNFDEPDSFQIVQVKVTYEI